MTSTSVWRVVFWVGLVVVPGTSALAESDQAQQARAAANGVQQANSARAANTLIAQKMAMLEQAMTSSRLANRLRLNADSPAAPVFASAQNELDSARQALQRGELDKADDALSQVTWLLFQAQSLDPTPDLEAQKMLSVRLAEAVSSLRQSYLDTRARLGSEQTDDRAAVMKIDRMVAQARRHADGGQYDAAIGQYEQAQKALLNEHQVLLGSAVVVYDKRFDSLTDEYRFELMRNHDYQRLVPVAIERYQPDAAKRDEVQRMARDAGDTTLQAELMAAEGKHPKAIELLQGSTERLQKALAMAGLVVPQSMPAQ